MPVNASVADTCAAAALGCSNWLTATAVDDTATVGTLGGGVECAFARNWSIRGEYMFIGLGGHDLTSCVTATLASGAVAARRVLLLNHDFPDIHTAKVGVHWRVGS